MRFGLIRPDASFLWPSEDTIYSLSGCSKRAHRCLLKQGSESGVFYGRTQVTTRNDDVYMALYAHTHLR